MPQSTGSIRRLTVAENLRLFARLEGLDDVEARSSEMLEQTGLAERRDDQVGTLSGGNQQRVNIAIGLLASPAVLLLDEPSTGLDPRQRERLWEFVLGLAGAGTTVIYSTHHLHRGGALRRPPARPRRRRADLRRHRRGAARRGRRRLRPTSRPRSSASCASAGTEPMRWLLAQGPADPAALAADRRAAGRLPGRPRGPDRLRALGRQLQAAGRVPQRGPEHGSSSRSAAATTRSTATSPASELCTRVECVDVSSREEASRRSGRRRDRGADPAAGPARQAQLARDAESRSSRRSRCSSTRTTRSRRASSTTGSRR